MTSKLSAYIVVGIVAAITLTVLSFAAAVLILYIPAFILWTSITVQWLLVLRISIVVGVVLAVLFIFSAEGKSTIDGYLREVRK